jgi:hypothetical protein
MADRPMTPREESLSRYMGHAGPQPTTADSTTNPTGKRRRGLADGAAMERARIRGDVEAIPNVIDADVEHRAHVQQGIEIMRARVLAAIEGGPTDA